MSSSLAASERARNTIVTAGAGSGKTRTLVARYLGLLGEGLAAAPGGCSHLYRKSCP